MKTRQCRRALSTTRSWYHLTLFIEANRERLNSDWNQIAKW
jgi:hypothetical protein